MPAAMHLELDEHYSQQIHDLAVTLHRTPESVADEVLAGGMHMLQRYAYLKKRSENANIERAIEFLNRPGNNNPPDPGDELPDDLKYLLDERRP